MTGFYRIILGQRRACGGGVEELGREVPAPELDDWMANEGIAKALFLGEIAGERHAHHRPLGHHSRTLPRQIRPCARLHIPAERLSIDRRGTPHS